MSSTLNRTISLFVAAAAGAAFVYFAVPISPSRTTESRQDIQSETVSMDTPEGSYAITRDLVLDEHVRKALTNLNVNEEQIGRGIYRLKGTRWTAAPTRSLIDFPLPRTMKEESFWASLSKDLSKKGFELADAKQSELENRARFKALMKEGHPVLVLRAYPAGPRVSVIVDGLGHEPGLVEDLMSLDEDVTFSVDARSPFANVVSKTLVEKNREVIAHLPLNGRALSTAEPNNDEALGRRQLDTFLDETLEDLGIANGVDFRHTAGADWPLSKLEALLGSLGRRGYFLFDRDLIPEDKLETLTHNTGVRVGQRTHEIRDEAGISATLKGLNATLAYSGHIHLSVQATPAVLKALKPWLESLRQRNVPIMRLSEVVK